MPTQRSRILVIDDDEEMRRTIRDTLSAAGYDVKLARSAQEGLSIFDSEQFHLVFVDIFMPLKDGLEVLMEIQRKSGLAKLLAISGGGKIRFGQVLTLAERLGAAATLAKAL